MIRLRIELLKLFVLEFEWISNKKKENVDDKITEDVVDTVDDVIDS